MSGPGVTGPAEPGQPAETGQPGEADQAGPLKRIGFIGLGSQGAPMARRIIGAGYPMTLWARRPATLEA
ncbi:MAG: NAD(P)-binding domain-containing protein, partial [Streptosporangiaceae bacterium]